MPTPSRSINETLARAQLAIDAALASPEIQGFLAPLGYPLETLQAGRALYEAAAAAQQNQKMQYAEQIGATSELDRLRETANTTYMRHLAIARVAFKNDPMAQSALVLNGERKRNFAGWLAQTQQFYGSLSEDARLQEPLARFSITPEVVAEARAQIQAVLDANVARETERGEAQRSTQDRDLALDALQDWMSDFLAIARVALEPDPQLLEALGIRA